MKVLLIGAEPETAEKVNLAARLRWPDAIIHVAAEPDKGLHLVEEHEPDVVMFQSDPGGWPIDRFIQELRAFSDVPLIILEPEGGGGQMDEVRALESGADDYILRSAGIIDLVARLVALIRRAKIMEPSPVDSLLSSGSLTLDPATFEVYLNGRSLSLTSTEFRMLHLLLKNRGQVVTHDFLARSLWGDRVDSSPLAKKYVQRLRRKLGDGGKNPQWIANVYGVGYRMVQRRVPAPEETRASSSSRV